MRVDFVYFIGALSRFFLWNSVAGEPVLKSAEKIVNRVERHTINVHVLII